MLSIKKNQFSKLVVSIIIILNVLFAAGVLYVFLKVGNEPSTLVLSWFGFTGGELWMLSSIKKRKIRKGEKDEDKLETETNKP